MSTPGLEPFSAPWVTAWANGLRASDAYRHAARGWEGGVVLEVRAPTGAALGALQAVYLDLWHGECRAARLAGSTDYDSAAYVLSGTMDAWMQILHGDVSPIMAIMRGMLKLKKGWLPGLVPHAAAAVALVKVAQDLEAGVAEVPPRPALPTSPQLSSQPHPVAAREQASGRDRLQSTSAVGIRFDSFPMRLWDKAKRLGIWNPADIDLTQDRADWLQLAPDERDMLTRLASLFQAGEEAVTLDILPLVDVMAQEGRLEEQMYLTSFLWEEAKHVEMFRRFFDVVADLHTDLTPFHSPSYQTIFGEALPQAMGRLRTDRSPIAQAEASATYNMIVEGVLAETGYHLYHQVLTVRGIMPGMQRAAAYLKTDESRHLAYGVYLLSRLIAEHGDPVWNAIMTRMNALLLPAVAVVSEAFAAYPRDRVPFGLKEDEFVQFAMAQFQKRVDRLEKARTQGSAELFLDDGLDLS